MGEELRVRAHSPTPQDDQIGDMGYIPYRASMSNSRLEGLIYFSEACGPPAAEFDMLA